MNLSTEVKVYMQTASRHGCSTKSGSYGVVTSEHVSCNTPVDTRVEDLYIPTNSDDMECFTKTMAQTMAQTLRNCSRQRSILSEERRFGDRRQHFLLKKINRAKANVYTLGVLLTRAKSDTQQPLRQPKLGPAARNEGFAEDVEGEQLTRRKQST